MITDGTGTTLRVNQLEVTDETGGIQNWVLQWQNTQVLRKRGFDADSIQPSGPAIKWRPQFIEVVDYGKLALTRGPYPVTTPTADRREIEGWGTFNSVWRLHDDGE